MARTDSTFTKSTYNADLSLPSLVHVMVLVQLPHADEELTSRLFGSVNSYFLFYTVFACRRRNTRQGQDLNVFFVWDGNGRMLAAKTDGVTSISSSNPSILAASILPQHTPPEWAIQQPVMTREVVYYIFSGTPRSVQKYFCPNLTADFFGDNHFFLICDQNTNQTSQLIGFMDSW